jgi:hypothetical protein
MTMATTANAKNVATAAQRALARRPRNVLLASVALVPLLRAL